MNWRFVIVVVIGFVLTRRLSIISDVRRIEARKGSHL